MSIVFESREDARRQHSELMRKRSAAYGKPEYADLCKQEQELMDAAIGVYAKPEVPGCRQCEEYSIFGGPSHRASLNCRSGRHPHCTCDTCF